MSRPDPGRTGPGQPDPGQPSYVAAFRAYKWNADIAALARRFFDSCSGGRHVVLLNEEHGPIDVGPYETVSHGKDFGEYGLPERPLGQSPWYNSDYIYALLRLRLPGYEYYLISESDVAVNLPLGPMVADAARRGIDALVHDLGPVSPDWVHAEAASAQANPLRCFLFICLFSGRALEALLAGRVELARRPDFAERPWPLVESYVPTALRDAGMTLGDVAAYMDTTHLRYRPFLSLSDPRTFRPGSATHPALGQADLLRGLMHEHPPMEFFSPGTQMAEVLGAEPLEQVAPFLIENLAYRQEHEGVARLHAMMSERGLSFPHERDLAHAKPALISSVSQWSLDADPRRDACGANGWRTDAYSGFHTGREPNAWWQVDLLEECVVDRIEIVNRLDMPERFVRFTIESSRDGVVWSVRHLKDDEEPVSFDADAPWSVDLPEPFLARLVRVRRLGPPDYLHLRRVRVFGRTLLRPSPVLRETILDASWLSAAEAHIRGGDLRGDPGNGAAVADGAGARIARLRDRGHRGISLDEVEGIEG